VPLFDYLIGRWHARRYFHALFTGEVANPPSYIKFNMMKSLQREFRLTTLIETGTYYGDTCYRARNVFRSVVSIEVDDELFTRAVRRLAAYPNIQIRKGDCLKILPTVVRELRAPALFFLDAHYSGAETSYGTKKDPIIESLNVIAKSKQRHVILIDDLRTFDGSHVHLYDLLRTVKTKFPKHNVRIYNDMIILHP